MSQRCVCTCPEDQHRPETLSVPLRPNPKPNYPFTRFGATNPNATYEHLACGGCGSCCSYTPDTGTDT